MHESCSTEKDIYLPQLATVVKTDVMAANGVIHVIDSVILPKCGG